MDNKTKELLDNHLSFFFTLDIYDSMEYFQNEPEEVTITCNLEYELKEYDEHCMWTAIFPRLYKQAAGSKSVAICNVTLGPDEICFQMSYQDDLEEWCINIAEVIDYNIDIAKSIYAAYLHFLKCAILSRMADAEQWTRFQSFSEKITKMMEDDRFLKQTLDAIEKISEINYEYAVALISYLIFFIDYGELVQYTPTMLDILQITEEKSAYVICGFKRVIAYMLICVDKDMYREPLSELIYYSILSGQAFDRCETMLNLVQQPKMKCEEIVGDASVLLKKRSENAYRYLLNSIHSPAFKAYIDIRNI